MAIDTREKRASVLSVGRPWSRTKEPGTVDEAWRLASGMAYAGNALSPPGAALGGRPLVSAGLANRGLINAGLVD